MENPKFVDKKTLYIFTSTPAKTKRELFTKQPDELTRDYTGFFKTYMSASGLDPNVDYKKIAYCSAQTTKTQTSNWL